MKRLPLYIFLTASAISMIGNSLTMIAVPWFVLETTGSAAKTGLVGFFTALPAVLAAFFGGTLVDRLGYKRMSIISDLASGLTVALIPLLYITIGLQFWQLLLLVFLSALLDAPGNTARQALLPDLATLTATAPERVNAWQQTVQRSATLVGPAVAGLLITFVGSSQVLWLDAASFVVSALLFAVAIPARQAHAVAPVAYFEQLREGLRFVRRSRLILSLVLTVAITNFLDAPVFAVVMPVYAKQIYNDAAKLGLMLSSFGAGAVIGGLIFGAVGQRLPRRVTFIILFVLVGLPFWVLALTPPFPMAVAALFWAGLAAGPINPILMTVFQERIPPEMRGRVFGMIMAIALMAAPLGMVLTGYLLERLTVTVTLLIIAACYLLVTIGQIFNPALRDMDNQQTAPDYV
ncbi:MAG TPA: MFS transporter [Anaerolineae bacterium]|nr:MFS transporter [Anaerolineae bacterium]HXW01416.1 MFS transporter [Anaerolineae bacterium]